MANEKTGHYSPEGFAETVQNKKGGLKLPEGVKATTAAADYEKSRKPDFYQSIKIGDTTVETTFKNSTNQATVTKLKEAIKTALELTQATKDAILKFEKDMNRLDKVCKSKPNGVGPYALVHQTAKYKTEFLNAIEEQQKNEISHLETILDQDKIKAAFGVNDEKEVTAIKDQFINALKKEHGNRNDVKNNSQMKAFLDPLNTEQESQFTHIKKEYDALYEKVTMANFVNPDDSKLTTWFKRSFLFSQSRLTPFEPQAPGAMQEEMKKTMEENKKKEAANAPPVPTQVSNLVDSDVNNDKGIGFKNLNIKELQNIQTTTGRKITKIADNHYEIKIPPLSAWDYWSPHNKKDVTNDIQSLAQRIKAEGHDSIKFTLDHKDEDVAKDLAGIAYAESLKAGFEPNKITVIINGKAYKGDELKQFLTGDALNNAMEAQKRTKEVYKSIRNQHADEKEIGALDKELKNIEEKEAEAAAAKAPGHS
ncbi:MAG: hypothetical protein A3F46_03385 [Legionellales bacterium RIFCSPHIGHO2_12_FULL_42_9]|nr:MAG: hypothetical protein A3F46_03385 [Legionellales bacterium RIFCSPHIGHO2_12_FULL_42_9]